MKKLRILLLSCVFMIAGISCVHAADMNMYVNGIFVVRDVQTVGEFDMLPILDIAGELGYECTFDGTTAVFYNSNQSYTLLVGEASVFDRYGNWYGLDVVPQVIHDNLYVPAKFFQDAMGISYTWDWLTKTIFMGSDATYKWLIQTEEYKAANPKYMAELYANSFWNAATIVAYGGEMVGNHRKEYRTTDLFYYMADVNYDGILDLVVASEASQSNGVIVYTYRNGHIQQLFAPGMPYSSGVEMLTLATYNGRYGIFRHRANSIDEFNFYHITSDGDRDYILSGYHLQDLGKNLWVINDKNIGEPAWQSTFNSIQPVQFYSIWDLASLADWD